MKKFFQYLDVKSLVFHEQGRKLSLFYLSLPIFVQSILDLLMGTVNTLMLSGYMEDAAGATTVANQIISSVITISSIIPSGTTMLISIALGEKDRKKAAEIAGTGLIFALSLSAVVSTVVFVFSSPILSLMGLEGEVLVMGVDYLQIKSVGLFFNSILTFCSLLLTCNGRSLWNLIRGMTMSAVNVLLVYLFLYKNLIPSFTGTRAVALANIVNTFVSLLIVVVMVILLKCPFKMVFRPAYFKRIFTVGVPGGISGVSYSLAQTVTTGFMGSFGMTALNAKTYLSDIAHYSFMFGGSFATGNRVLMGRFAGEKNLDKMKRLSIFSLLCGLLINTTVSLVIFIFNQPLIRLYSSNEDIFRLAAIILGIDVIVTLARSVNQVIESSLNAALDVKYTFIITLITRWGCSVGLSFLFGIVFDWGLVGCWIAFAVDEVIKSVFFSIRWFSGKWKKALFESKIENK